MFLIKKVPNWGLGHLGVIGVIRGQNPKILQTHSSNTCNLPLKSSDISDKERQIILRRINARPDCAYVITHGTDTLVETAKFLSSFLTSGVVILTGAKLPEGLGADNMLFSHFKLSL